MIVDPDKVMANIDPVELTRMRELSASLDPKWWPRIVGMLIGAGLDEQQAIALVGKFRGQH
jgi:hypothetical protein